MAASPNSASQPALSVVVVAYEMARELPRTLETLTLPYQRDIAVDDYEVLVVDNGSATPLGTADFAAPNVRYLAPDRPTPSPVGAANLGLEAASGQIVGLLLDGARMVSPGLLHHALGAVALAPRSIVTTLAFHLGHEPQMVAAKGGYDQAAEDRLLATIDWRSDGYSLFDISAFAGSSHRGWFGPLGESNALFMPQNLWAELGGLDPEFDRPGGGLANHDLYRRACELPDVRLVMLLGEGSFHQFHAGAATGGTASRDELWAEYERIRGRAYAPPTNDVSYLGHAPVSAMRHLDKSLALARARRAGGSRPGSGSLSR